MSEKRVKLLVDRRDGVGLEEVICGQVLRRLKGRREVYDGTWDGREVIAKVFFDKFSARRHAEREWEGLKVFSKHGLSCAKGLFYGRTDAGGWAVVTEKIVGATESLEMWQTATCEEAKFGVLAAVSRELAREHKKGVMQGDLHLGNFLIRGDEVFAIDPAQIKAVSGELDKARSIRQIAGLSLYYSDNEKERMGSLFSEYGRSRGWEITESDEFHFWKEAQWGRSRSIERGLRKSLRSNKRHELVKNDSIRAVFDRNFCSGESALKFIAELDWLMKAGEIYKRGNSSLVSRFTCHDKDIVVKRYNHKNLVHSFRHTIKGSKAKKSWLNGQRLLCLSILTPKPLAYIEHYKFGLVWESYIVTEFVKGRKMYDYFQDQSVSSEDRKRVKEKISHLFEHLEKHRISHGDMKHTNILINGDELILTDLDAMFAHHLQMTYRFKQKKDIARFEKAVAFSERTC